MKKRLLSIFLVFCLMLSVTPMIALADAAHVHCVCGKTTTCGGSHNADTTWTSVSSLGEITTAGNYYLENDISFSNAWVCSIDGVNICLNGHALTCTGGGAYGQGCIKVDMGANLTITDCKARGTITSRDNYGFYIKGTLTLWNGNITNCYFNGVYNVGGTFTMNGGSITGNNTSGVANYDGGTFTMNGGNITGNNVKLISTYGGGVHNKGMFTMTGGTISGNSASYGGGVCNEGTFTIIGGTISGNVYLRNGKTLTVENYKPLTEGATISVTTESTPTAGNPVVITSGNADKNYFRSDVDTYDVGTDNNGRVVLQVHSFGDDYLHDEMGHWQVCQNDGCTVTTEKAAHSGGIATCTNSAVCTICGGTIPIKEHALTWQSENGEYWQKCSNCDFETEKKSIPVLTRNAPDKVCRTQDYTFSFTLPESCTLINAGYEFEKQGSELDATFENGIYTATLESSAYAADEDGFKITVNAKTADGFIVKEEKTVTIQSKHSGGAATCMDKAVCEICGEEYGDLAPHKLTHTDAKSATAAETGNTEYWYCDVCDKYFSDKNCTNEIALADTVISKLAPKIINGNGNKASQQTGDSSNLALWIVLLFISGGSVIGTTVVRKKITYNR